MRSQLFIASSVFFLSAVLAADPTPEECLSSCATEGLTASQCDISKGPTLEAFQCACAKNDFVTGINACVEKNCPQFHADLQSEIDSGCKPADADSCALGCTLTAVDATNCDKDEAGTCTCSSPNFMTTLTSCTQAACPDVAQSILDAAKASCDANLSGSATNGGTATNTGSQTSTKTTTKSTPSDTKTSDSQTPTTSDPAASPTSAATQSGVVQMGLVSVVVAFMAAFV
ncbi:hypothetical protein BKA62DRAFT_754221 [Auriculariales sp. MPI-PUGE-AT-0066]|nr:hypothetical protein BKA62DRAFT_754221 [Auriculariales sp. MPI-PUGE-AT-0066]